MLDSLVTRNHEFQLTRLAEFSKIYAKKYFALKFEYEKIVLIMEKTIADQNQRHGAYFKKMETENLTMFAHIVQFTRKIEIIITHINKFIDIRGTVIKLPTYAY